MKLRKWLQKKRYVKLVFCFVLLGIQILYGMLLCHQLMHNYKAVEVLIRCVSVLAALVILTTDEEPYQKLTYCVLILWVPLLGLLYYVLFNFHPSKRKNARKYRQVYQWYFPTLSQKKNAKTSPEKFVLNHTNYESYQEENTMYFSSGEKSYEHILRDLALAKKYIMMEFYILEPGILFDAILEVLCEKIDSGVEVYFIYDAVGSAGTLPMKYYKRLQKKGIHCAAFHPIGPLLSPMINNRDHRKMIVIDDRIAYIGGSNLADEYINCKHKYGHWKDCVLRMEGASALSNRKMFCCLWTYITGKRIEVMQKSTVCMEIDQNICACAARITPFSSSPFDDKSIAEGIYLRAIYEAKKYLYIFTPYLILDAELSGALGIASQSGVDVRIVTPGIPDKKLVYLETQSYYPMLLKAGVRIFQYSPGFLHAKCLLYDDQVAIVGSVNLDFRSMYHHFECGCILYESMAIPTIKLDMVSAMKASKEYRIEDCNKQKNTIYRGLLCVLRLLNPML